MLYKIDLIFVANSQFTYAFDKKNRFCLNRKFNYNFNFDLNKFPNYPYLLFHSKRTIIVAALKPIEYSAKHTSWLFLILGK